MGGKRLSLRALQAHTQKEKKTVTLEQQWYYNKHRGQTSVWWFPFQCPACDEGQQGPSLLSTVRHLAHAHEHVFFDTSCLVLCSSAEAATRSNTQYTSFGEMCFVWFDSHCLFISTEFCHYYVFLLQKLLCTYYCRFLFSPVDTKKINIIHRASLLFPSQPVSFASWKLLQICGHRCLPGKGVLPESWVQIHGRKCTYTTPQPLVSAYFPCDKQRAERQERMSGWSVSIWVMWRT